MSTTKSCSFLLPIVMELTECLNWLALNRHEASKIPATDIVIHATHVLYTILDDHY